MARLSSSCNTVRVQSLALFGALALPTAAWALNGTCCTTIQSLLPDKVFYEGEWTFGESMSTYWTAQETDHPPACIVHPATAQEVSAVVQSLVELSKSMPSNPCYFAVRSGGSGHDHKSNEPDGVNIDLSWWRVLTLPVGYKTVQILPGDAFGHIYEYLDRYNLSIAGPRYGSIGVGGYSLGGGISYLSPQVGFGSDTVVNYEVVLSTGEIVNANASSNPDLYVALRGGQNNFGIVTRVDFSTFPLGKIHGGTIVQHASTVSDQLKTLNAFATSSNYDEKSNIIQSFAFDGQRIVAVNNLVYMEHTPTLPATLQQFVDLGTPVSNSVGVTSLGELMRDSRRRPVNASRHVIYTTTFKPSVNMMNTIFEIWNASTANLQMLNLSYTLAFEPIPAVLLSNSAKRGGNVLGLSPSDGPLIVVLLTAAWQNSTYDTLVDTTARNCIEAIDQAASKMGMLHPFKYIGYAEENQEVLQGYGEQNIEFMKNVSKRYDPGQIFQTLVRGGFKLSDLK